LGDYHGFLMINYQKYGGKVKRERKVDYDFGSPEYWKNVSSIYNQTSKALVIPHKIIDNNIAYVGIPLMLPNGGGPEEVKECTIKLRNGICELKKKIPKYWIIDLRFNLGGNMYPMMMGLAELLPKEIQLGGDTYDGEIWRSKWTLKDGIFDYNGAYTDIPPMNYHDSKTPKIAVLMGRYTSSSGETVACAFKGQEQTKLFGEVTSGSTTANWWMPIGDKVVFNPAVSYFADRNFKVYKDGIIPDVNIVEDFDYLNPFKGKVIAEAIQWLKH
jgi:C-terminal processing protease CtpA/Prc